MKPKDALIKDGKVPTTLGRGRMNAAQIARIKELVAEGWNIEGYSVSKPINSTAPVTVEKVKSDPNAVLDVPEPSRNEANWNAFIGGKKIGMREVCRRCSNSFTYCYCEKPLFPIDVSTFGVVVFKPKVVSQDKR